MAQEQPETPPSRLKPWYYQDWFLFPMIVFWPLWPVLILRSPWHNGILSGAVAWAMLFVWSYLIVWEQLYKTQRLNEVTILVVIPGLLFTTITQIHWSLYKKNLTGAARQSDGGDARNPGEAHGQEGPHRRTRRRRRPRR